MKKGYAFAGSNAFLAEKISSVKEVMSTLEREFSWQPINWLTYGIFIPMMEFVSPFTI